MNLQQLIKEVEKSMDENPMTFSDRIHVVSNEPNYHSMLRGTVAGQRLTKTAKYKVGDRVECIQTDPMRPELVGKTGIVRSVFSRDIVRGMSGIMPCFFYSIQFENFTRGHNGDNVGSTDTTHWILGEEYIKLTCQKAKKERMSLSTLAKRTFDPDTKALVEIGLLNNDLRMRDPNLLFDMLIAINFKALAEEAVKRLAEAKEESK